MTRVTLFLFILSDLNAVNHKYFALLTFLNLKLNKHIATFYHLIYYLDKNDIFVYLR